MQIEHIAIWVNGIEKMKSFYEKYFNCVSNDKYINHNKQFESYFLSFENDARIELMKMPSIPENALKDQYTGFAHLAIKTNNKHTVDALTQHLKNDGYTIISEPRETGDGYYESCILDPENNRIEITA